MSLDAQVSGIEPQDDGWGHLYQYDFRTRKVGCSCGWRKSMRKKNQKQKQSYLFFEKHLEQADPQIVVKELLDENGSWRPRT